MARAAWIALCLALPMLDIPAQAPDSLLVSGARVRVWTRTRAYVARVGRVQRRQGDSLDLRLQYPLNDQRTGTEYARLTLFQLDSAQVSVRTGWTARRSGALGALAGGVVGGILGAMAVSSRDRYSACAEPAGLPDSCNRRYTAGELFEGVAVGGILGAILGGTTGGVIGAWKSHRWVGVTLPYR
ncbi:MAG TPA: hypothetical protein VF483_01845 [Gemmatimonadaceae bacterium]